MPDHHRYPVAPLLALTGMTISQLTRQHGISGTTATLGLTEAVADRVACAHGLHPLVIWPDWDTHTPEHPTPTRRCANTRCRREFEPDDPRRRYCTEACRQQRRNRDRFRRRYHADPAFRTRHQASVRAYRDSIGREAVNAAQRRYRTSNNKDTAHRTIRRADPIERGQTAPGQSPRCAHDPAMQETTA